MVVGKNSIIEAMRSGSLKYWRLYGSNGTDLITGTENPDNEDLSLEDSISFFEKWIDLVGSGSYVLIGWQKAKQLKERAKIRFELPTSQGIGGIGTNHFVIPEGISEDKVQEAVNKAISEYKKEEEMNSLKKRVLELESENKDLTAQLDGTQNQLMGRLAPYIDPLMQGLGFKTPQGPSVSGVNDVQNGNEYQERLEKAFDRWMSVESSDSVLVLVEKIAELAINEPQKYSLAKSML